MENAQKSDRDRRCDVVTLYVGRPIGLGRHHWPRDLGRRPDGRNCRAGHNAGNTPRGSSPRSACQLPGQHVTLAAVVPGSSVPPFSAVTTVGAGWRCFMAPANYSPADTAMGWSTQANKKPCAKEGLERHRRSERDWEGARAYSTVFRISRKACTGELTTVYAILTMSAPHDAQWV
jgi:hypothetical protein